MTATAWRADAGTSGEQASVGVGRTVRRCGGVLAVLLVALALIAAPSRADIPAGRAAYDAGDYAKAYAEFSALARQGNAIAQYELGNMYRLGRGVAQDEAEAARRYRRAAAQGDAPSQFWLGLMYQLGKGVPKDEKEGTTWLRKAAEQGYAPAQHILGVTYFRRLDHTKAYMWNRIAAVKM